MEFKEEDNFFGFRKKDLENIQIIKIVLNFREAFSLMICLKKNWDIRNKYIGEIQLSYGILIT